MIILFAFSKDPKVSTLLLSKYLLGPALNNLSRHQGIVAITATDNIDSMMCVQVRNLEKRIAFVHL